ncbi:anti-sigma factor [Acidithiobacillus sp. IBUN Pt1247-S3]|uniref:anti-sigma factor n=1 Tax=Acidithiobacillus sp. IBUN Pt1247-S3 TaxID=3166642 RepID=UPI0034E43109
MNLRKHPQLAEQMAAAYVIGSLRGRARLRFARLLQQDIVLAQMVERWEDALLPALLPARAQSAPARVWHGIQAQLPKTRLARETSRHTARAAQLPWWRRLALWQGVSAALAVAIVVTWLWPSAPQMPMLAVVNNSQGQATWVFHASAHHMRLVTLRHTVIPADKSLQLWAIVPGKKPVSMGLLPMQAGETPILPAPDDMNLSHARLLAVTMEPAGGSPTGQPTGPILLKATVISS